MLRRRSVRSRPSTVGCIFVDALSHFADDVKRLGE
jgi:hypothetical protein